MSTPTLNELKQRVLLLSEEDRKDLTAFLLTQERKDDRAVARDFSRDMEWIRNNRAAYRGQFVALHEGRLIAHDANERDVWQAAVKAGSSVPFLAYLETEAEETCGGW